MGISVFRNLALTTILATVLLAVAAAPECFAQAGGGTVQEDDSLSTAVVLANVPVLADTLAGDSVAIVHTHNLAATGSAEPQSLSPEEFLYAGLQRYTITGGRPYRETSVGLVPTLIVGGTVAAASIGLHIHQANAWWADQRGPFHVQDDWDYALQADKAGHFVAGYALAYFGGEAMMTSGFSWEAATWTGAAIGLAYHTYVEIEDGFATNWGFSPSDMASNTLGSVYYVLQYYVPELQNFQPKWQFIPAKWTGELPIPHATAVFDDYASSTFFLSVNMHRVLPDAVAEHWPAWLNLAVGYGVREVGYEPDRLPTKRVVLALDYNMVELLPEGPGFWNWIRQSMNFIKLPSPALEIGPVTRFRLMYPFEFSVSDFKF